MRTIWLCCCGLFLFMAASAVCAQPAVSRGQQILSITYEECLRRAQGAYSAEGWVNIGTSWNAVNAFKDNHAAYIVCNPDPNGKMAVNVFVASSTNDSGVPGYERQKLQGRMDQSASNNQPRCENWAWAYAPPGQTPAPHGYVTICTNNTAKYSETGDTATGDDRETRWCSPGAGALSTL